MRGIMKSYYIVYADVDFKDDDVLKSAVWSSLALQEQAKIYVFETRKGFHLELYLKDAVLGHQVLEFLLKIRTDQHYILNWLKKGEFTLFEVRRGLKNRKELDIKHIIDEYYKKDFVATQ